MAPMVSVQSFTFARHIIPMRPDPKQIAGTPAKRRYPPTVRDRTPITDPCMPAVERCQGHQRMTA